MKKHSDPPEANASGGSFVLLRFAFPWGKVATLTGGRMRGGRQLVIQCRGEACLDVPADGILVVKIDAGADGTEKKAPLCRGSCRTFRCD